MTASADAFVASLRALAEVPALRRRLGPDDEAFGMRMGSLFAAAKDAAAMPLDEVEALLASPVYEVRMGAFCILDFRVKARRVTPAERERCYRLYLDHHDRITTWDRVDRAAPAVVGGWLRGRDPVVHAAVGIALRHAGGRDPDAVTAFLDRHAAVLPRSVLRAAVAKLPPAERSRRLGRPAHDVGR